MMICDQYKNPVMAFPRNVYCRETDNHGLWRQEYLLSEHTLDMEIDHARNIRLVCTPQHLTELVLGHLLTEGIIRDIQDIRHLSFDGNGHHAQILLRQDTAGVPAAGVSAAGVSAAGVPAAGVSAAGVSAAGVSAADVSAAGVSAADVSAAGVSAAGVPAAGVPAAGVPADNPTALVPLTPAAWQPAWIIRLWEHFQKDMPLHRKTHGTHSCYLSREGELLFSCEDMGRHNTFDKCIGYALRNQIDLHPCIAYSSGRIPTDMVVKAVRARIPILVSKEYPTLEAVELADTCGLTLLQTAKDGTIRQYTGQNFKRRWPEKRNALA